MRERARKSVLARVGDDVVGDALVAYRALDDLEIGVVIVFDRVGAQLGRDDRAALEVDTDIDTALERSALPREDAEDDDGDGDYHEGNAYPKPPPRSEAEPAPSLGERAALDARFRLDGGSGNFFRGRAHGRFFHYFVGDKVGGKLFFKLRVAYRLQLPALAIHRGSGLFHVLIRRSFAVCGVILLLSHYSASFARFSASASSSLTGLPL